MSKRFGDVRRVWLLTVLAALLSVASLSPSATADSHKPASPDRGPVGWELYRNLDRLAELPEGAEVLEFSSFDRTGGNNDGFTGEYSCLRTTEEGCVLAEAAGPGEIVMIAQARTTESLSPSGNLTIELDGEVVVNAPAQDVIDGKLGAPFVYPLVGNLYESSGESYIMVPMPYRESMRVTIENAGSLNFYHIGYRKFADATGVETFDPSDPAEDVVALLQQAGESDPKPTAKRAKTEAHSFDLAPGESAHLATLHGPGTISELALRLPQVVALDAGPLIFDDGRSFGSDGFSEFTVAIDPENQGARLTRRLNTFEIYNQGATVSVDGVEVGQWEPVDTTLSNRWADVAFDIPAALTAGKSSIVIRNQGAPGFREHTYWVDSLIGGVPVRTDELSVGPDSAASEQAHSYQIANQCPGLAGCGILGGIFAGPGREGRRYAPVGDPDVIAASDELLANLRLQITFDGQRTVDSPVGEFFGSGTGAYPVSALMFAMDPHGDGWNRSWWPMPYRQSAVVELVNGSDQHVELAESEVTWAREPGNARGLGPNGDMGYFHTTSHTAQVEPDNDWIFLDTDGRGKFVGVSHTMVGLDRGGFGSRGYLEGDARFYVDGSRSPQMHNTGTEEFYQGGWYYWHGTFSNPQNGNPAHRMEEFGCEIHCESAYRLMLTDAVPFSSSATLGMEVGSNNDWDAIYGSTAFWYGRTEPAMATTDTVDVGNEASEQAHNYNAEPAGERAELTSVFEGDHDDIEITEDGRATSAAIEFTLTIDPRNRGVTLRRMSDQQDSYQAARVLIDGRDAGVWLQPLGNTTQRWLDDSFHIPPELTARSSEIDVTLLPLDDAPPWHAANYEALNHLLPAHAAQGCSDVIIGLHLGSLDVTEGVTCLDNAVVLGPVTVGANAEFHSSDSAITGRVRANGAAEVTMCDTRLLGQMLLADGKAVTFGDPANECGGNLMLGSASVTGTNGQSVVGGNHIIGRLDCSGNEPPPVNNGSANMVVGRTTGQCSDL